MRVVVAGCGRVGSALAVQLAAEHHEVVVIDPEPKARRRLPDSFTGRFVEGSAYDRAVLDTAAADRADAFVAVTPTDNANVVAARTAKETYRVPLVIAQQHDFRHAGLYRDFAIPTVSAASWTVREIHRTLLHRHLEPELAFGDNETLIVRSQLPAYLTGRRLADLDVDGEIRVVELTRSGRSSVPAAATVAEPGDLVTFVVAASAASRLRGFLNRELGT